MSCRLLLFLAGLLCSLTVSASDYDVLLDASGSMRGFQKYGLDKITPKCPRKNGTGIGNNWKSFLGEVQKDAQKTCTFGDEPNCFSQVPLYKICLDHQKTDMEGALRFWLNTDNKNQNLLIITDNVADTNDDNSSSNQDKFRELLSGSKSKFSHIAVITLRLPFKGKVSLPGSNKGNLYTGKRALVAYVLGRKGISGKSFKEFRDTIENKLERYDSKSFQIRPFDTGNVTRKNEEVTLDGSKSSNVKVEILKQGNGEDKVIVSNYTLGNSLDFTIGTSLQIDGAFKLKGINLKSDIEIEGLPEHLQGKNQAHGKVSPQGVTLSPTHAQDFKIKFEMDRYTYTDIPFKQKLQFALSNTLELDGKIDLLFTLKRRQYQPDKSLFQEWTHEKIDQLDSASESIQGKVYRLETILASGVADESNDEKLKSIPLTLEIRYAMGPIISAIALALVFLGVLYWLWLKSRSSQDYVIEDDMGGQKTLSVGLGQAYKHYDDRGRNLFSLRFLGFAYFVTTRFKFEGSRMLGSGQSFEILDKESDTYHSFYLRQIDNDTPSNSDDSYDW